MPARVAPLPPLHPRISEVTERVRARSAGSRFAAAAPVDKDLLRRLRVPSVAIVSAYGPPAVRALSRRNQGFKVALVTDGRMSGASGADDGAVARMR